MASIDWSTLTSVNPGNVPWVYYDLESEAATTPLFLSVSYVVWPILNFTTAPRRVHDYSGDEEHALGAIQSTKDPMLAIVLLKPDTILAASAFTPFSLRLLSLSSAMPIFLQSCMTSPSFHDSTIAPALVVSTLDASTLTCVFRTSFVAGPSSAAVQVSVDLGAGPSTGTSDDIAGISSSFLVHTSSAPSRPCADVLLAGSLPGGATDAGASDTATFSCQLAVARRQCDAARQKIASV